MSARPDNHPPLSGIDTVVFDIGNVLIAWNPEWLYQKLIPDVDQRQWFLEHICTMAWHTRQDAGRSVADGVRELSARYPQYQSLIAAFYLRWDEMIGTQPITGSVSLLEQVKAQGYRVYALSNFSAEMFPGTAHKFHCLSLFDGIVLSGAEKVVKPDPAIYRILFERYQITPQRSIFIDDNADNIAVAQRLGMHAIHFHSPQQTAQALRDLKVAVSI